MASRRMLSNDIVLINSFLSISKNAQRLYFFLMLSTDDDGFVSNYNGFIKSISGTKKEIAELREAGFIITFETNVCAIVHFTKQNKIKGDRHKATEHIDERNQLTLNARGFYQMKEKE